MKRHALHAALILALVTCAPRTKAENKATLGGNSAAPVPATGLKIERVVQGLKDPLYVTAPADDPRLFVVEQPGRIRIIKDGKLLPTPFVDLTDVVRSGGEQGLLSVAFHPRYRSNGFLFVNYTDHRGDTRVVRYQVGQDPDRVDRSSERLILKVRQPYENHNGGLVMFGPDGMLYVGMGDGGGAGDPFGNGQKLGTMLGKMLRIDVDHGYAYRVPRDNPFVGRLGVSDEIWAYGLRNPWRFCFDRVTGLLYIADVGQNKWEEIHVAPAATPGLDYGWNVMEGARCFKTKDCVTRGREMPVVEYSHDEGCSITGGFVYRGKRIPALVGHYLYSDYCRGWIRSFKYAEGVVTDHREWQGAETGKVTSFGEDAAGELYVCTSNGDVYRLAWAAPAPAGKR